MDVVEAKYIGTKAWGKAIRGEGCRSRGAQRCCSRCRSNRWYRGRHARRSELLVLRNGRVPKIWVECRIWIEGLI